MFPSHIFYTEIVYNKGEGNWLGCMFPESRGVDTLIISMWGKAFAEEFVGQIPACGRSTTACCISRNTNPSLAWVSKLYCFFIHLGNRAKGIFMYL